MHVGLKIVQLLDTKTGKLLASKGKTKATPSSKLSSKRDHDESDDSIEYNGKDPHVSSGEDQSIASEEPEEAAPKKRGKKTLATVR